MATEVDICNLALARLGDAATVSSIDPPEGSAQADHCARFYPIARDELLSSYPWRFAMKRKKLALLAEEPVGDSSAHYFALPADCLKLVRVHTTGLGSLPTAFEDFAPEPAYGIEQVGSAKALVIRADEVWVEYVSSRTAPSLFPSDFVSALAYLLASHLAGPMIPGSSGQTVSANMEKLFEAKVQYAIQNDADQRQDVFMRRDPYAGDAFLGSFHVGH